MTKVEVFFDHTCPYCYRGHGYLKELLPEFPDAEIIWCPVEAHPKAEEPEHLPYEDLAVMGALYVKETGGDELAYHERIYKAYFEEKQAPDDIAVLTKCACEIGADGEEFEKALRSGRYEKALQDANDYAYEHRNVWAVPAFVCGDADTGGEKRLDAAPGIGITKEQLRKFLSEACP